MSLHNHLPKVNYPSMLLETCVICLSLLLNFECVPPSQPWCFGKDEFGQVLRLFMSVPLIPHKSISCLI
ncbi:hypothetical protein THIOM_000546 [Candidatus Thiomargarita nelsonii]|uniref:Uncharacterized protein n=1 Tax=Candidatus Thiomargarita nelsonii TaxID=1003181 RepID=A0A176S6F6_9GAMM|nr:hypothetical protein THIOM_000546 [Candidatus Thiomargarita nelsonii]